PLRPRRHREANVLRGLYGDDQLELDRGLYRKFARLCAFQDAIGIRGRAPKRIEAVISIRQQPAEFSEETEGIDGRETVANCQRDNLRAMSAREAIRHHAQPTIRLARVWRGNGLEFC